MAKKEDLEWVEFPTVVNVKCDGKDTQRDSLVNVCLDPPMEFFPHPDKEDRTMFLNAYGMKEVRMGFANFKKLLIGNQAPTNA